MQFKNKRILVTGGSRGIGRAIARAFAVEGGRVAVHYGNRRGAAEETKRSLEGEGHILVQADMTDAEAIEKAVGSVVEAFGGIDVLVNNAGVFEEHPIDEVQLVYRHPRGRNQVPAGYLSSLCINHESGFFICFDPPRPSYNRARSCTGSRMG